MIFEVNKWRLLPSGERYQGSVDIITGVPHGLGIITCNSTHRFYVGEFNKGKRHGRGFLLECDEWTKVSDGYWNNDEFAEAIDAELLHTGIWKWAATEYEIIDFYANRPSSVPRCYINSIAEADADGAYSFNGSAYVTTYDDHKLLFCNRYGRVFTLAPGEEYHYDVFPDNDEIIKTRHLFKLYIKEPDYKELFEECKFDDIVQAKLLLARESSDIASKYFNRVFYQRDSIFMLSSTSLKLIERMANEGNSNAELAYGRYHIIATPSKDSTAISREFLSRAHEKGEADATAAMAEACEYGDIGEVDLSLAEKLLCEALEKDSEYAVVVQMKHLLFGTITSAPQPEKVIELADLNISCSNRQKMPFSLWYYFKALALSELKRNNDARECCLQAISMGSISAWAEMALIDSKFYDEGMIADKEAYNATLYNGVKHHNANCLASMKFNALIEFDNLSDEEQTDAYAQEIIDGFEESYRWGSKMAPELLGDIYYNGWIRQEVDYEAAWSWYAKAAIWENAVAYEKMYDMVNDHYIDVDLHLWDMLALLGARLGSKKMLARTVISYSEGRLTEFASEIEKYYEPVFDSDDFTIDDEENWLVQ